MWKNKKVILVALVAVAVLVGSMAGVVLAQTGNGDGSQPKTLLSRVAVILGMDQGELEGAFAQAQKEMRDEALDSWLKNLVDQGNMTQGQADQYKEWWQAKPDAPVPGPFGGGFGFDGFRGGMKGGRGHGCWGSPLPAPATPAAPGSGT